MLDSLRMKGATPHLVLLPGKHTEGKRTRAVLGRESACVTEWQLPILRMTVPGAKYIKQADCAPRAAMRIYCFNTMSWSRIHKPGTDITTQTYPVYDPSKGLVARYDFVKMELYLENKVLTKYLWGAKHCARDRRETEKENTKQAGMAPTLGHLSSRRDTNKRGKDGRPAEWGSKCLGASRWPSSKSGSSWPFQRLCRVRVQLSSHLVLHITFTILGKSPTPPNSSPTILHTDSVTVQLAAEVRHRGTKELTASSETCTPPSPELHCPML